MINNAMHILGAKSVADHQHRFPKRKVSTDPNSRERYHQQAAAATAAAGMTANGDGFGAHVRHHHHGTSAAASASALPLERKEHSLPPHHHHHHQPHHHHHHQHDAPPSRRTFCSRGTSAIGLLVALIVTVVTQLGAEPFHFLPSELQFSPPEEFEPESDEYNNNYNNLEQTDGDDIVTTQPKNSLDVEGDDVAGTTTTTTTTRPQVTVDRRTKSNNRTALIASAKNASVTTKTENGTTTVKPTPAPTLAPTPAPTRDPLEDLKIIWMQQCRVLLATYPNSGTTWTQEAFFGATGLYAETMYGEGVPIPHWGLFMSPFPAHNHTNLTEILKIMPDDSKKQCHVIKTHSRIPEVLFREQHYDRAIVLHRNVDDNLQANFRYWKKMRPEVTGVNGTCPMSNWTKEDNATMQQMHRISHTRYYCHWQNVSIPKLFVTYERLRAEPYAAFEKIFTFAGYPDANITRALQLYGDKKNGTSSRPKDESRMQYQRLNDDVTCSSDLLGQYYNISNAHKDKCWWDVANFFFYTVSG